MDTVNTCGCSCPQPVLLVLERIKSDAPAALAVLVDNEASLENVSRAAANRGYAVNAEPEEGGITKLVLQRS